MMVKVHPIISKKLINIQPNSYDVFRNSCHGCTRKTICTLSIFVRVQIDCKFIQLKDQTLCILCIDVFSTIESQVSNVTGYVGNYSQCSIDALQVYNSSSKRTVYRFSGKLSCTKSDSKKHYTDDNICQTLAHF